MPLENINPKQSPLPISQAVDGEPSMSGKQQQKAHALVVVMRHVRKLRILLGAGSLAPAAEKFQADFAAGALPSAVIAALAVLRPTKTGTCPNRATLYRWDAKYTKHLQGQAVAAAPKHKGRQRKEYGWELRALALYHIPSKPSYSAVAEHLRDVEGFPTATNSRVRSYLKTMPATLGPQSPARVGKHFHAQNRGRYVRRDTSCLLVGEVYSMDGHTVDTYLAHPFSGGIWRPELTTVIDITSRYIPGWYLSEAESTHSSMLALSHALLSHDHVNAWLHIDNGSGFKAKAMSDEALGYYARFSMQEMFSIPGNSKGRGHIERWFRTFRDKHDKLFSGGMFYCGDDMAPEINRRLHDQIKQGKRTLPTLAQYRDSVNAFIERYNNTPHSELDGQTPAELWAGLDRVPLEMPAEATVRERKARKVRRGMIQLDSRFYTHAELALYNDKLLPVEYSIHDDAHVWVYDDEDRLVCVAELNNKRDYLPASRLEEQREKRTRGRIKRLEKKIAEVEAQHRAVLTHDQQLEQIAALMGSANDAPVAHDAPAMARPDDDTEMNLFDPLLQRGPEKEKEASPLRLTPLDYDEE